ncbi:MAG TPA: hypothetical protein DCR14_02035 [Acidimicrobiaceae bacterium]|nr:hypothetical protein [Acidimicrobiaceae bacterium]
MALVAVRRLTTAPSLLPMLSAAVLLCGAPVALMAAVEAPAWAIALAAVSGVGTVLAEVVALTTVQRAVPIDTVGRVFGLLDSLTVGVVLLGTAAAGLLVDLIGLERSMVVVGAMVPAVVVLAAPRFLGVRGGAPAVPLGQLLASLPMLALARPSSLEPVAEDAVAGIGGPLLGAPVDADAATTTPWLDDHEHDATAPEPDTAPEPTVGAPVGAPVGGPSEVIVESVDTLHAEVPAVDPFDPFDPFGIDTISSHDPLGLDGLDGVNDGFDDGFDDGFGELTHDG